MTNMSVRTFTGSSSLDFAMANAANGQADQAEIRRSETNAANSAEAMPKEAREPLASHKPSATKPGVTFAAQDSLPKLPIPDLDATCKRYLEALEPLQSSREHRDTETAVREFQRAEGPELQERLKKYATGKSSYIEQFCR